MLIGQTNYTDDSVRSVFCIRHKTRWPDIQKILPPDLLEYCVHHSLLKGLVVEEVEQPQQPVEVFGRA
jgi:hypothetical protein